MTINGMQPLIMMKNGNISLEGNQTSDWEGAFYNTSFDQLFKNNYLDEGNSDIINQITINNPTNIKVLIAIPKNYQQIVI